jgi:hypothetical protein
MKDHRSLDPLAHHKERKMEPVVGLEPTVISVYETDAVATEATQAKLERTTGNDPATWWLEATCSAN